MTTQRQIEAAAEAVWNDSPEAKHCPWNVLNDTAKADCRRVAQAALEAAKAAAAARPKVTEDSVMDMRERAARIVEGDPYKEEALRYLHDHLDRNTCRHGYLKQLVVVDPRHARGIAEAFFEAAAAVRPKDKE